jgi:hypothetical protein
MAYVIARDRPHHKRPEETCTDYWKRFHRGLGCNEITGRREEAATFATPQGARNAMHRYRITHMEPRKA